MYKSTCTKHLSVGPLLEVAMSKECTPLWREAHFEVKIYKTHQAQSTFGSCDVEKVHAVVARRTSKSKCTKHTSVGPLLEVEMSKKCTLLWREAHFEVKMYKAPHVRATFGGSDVVSRGRRKGLCTVSKVSKTWGSCSIFNYNHHYTTLRSKTLHYTTTTPSLHSTTLHSTTLHYTTLHSITFNYTTLHYTPLHYTPLHYSPLHYTTFHYITLRYTPLHSTTLQLQLHNYTPLHSATLNYITLYYTTVPYIHYFPLHSTTLHYITLHYTTFHYTTVHYTPLHYTTRTTSTTTTTTTTILHLHFATLHYTEWHCTTDRQVDTQTDR